ncbi:GNAT family N-acetyltransferase [Psychrobacillus vulpis]|uniref:GNAT family N-acetyltransferase n=1 Tax=Psychrobacillus vulpis TaxID=2325572 RepID=A0A544TG88_9BACI|nr:GNAT family N-acetyltransferase [Psychrobacillus vulpis]TQR16462.1 GNAT family N-acetyltransferase [Psychrobacillus vulpis]
MKLKNINNKERMKHYNVSGLSVTLIENGQINKGELEMKIALADIPHTPQVVSFFKNNLDRNNRAIYSEEFLCPLGIKAAIKRKQMIVAIVDGQVVGAFRFYRKKTFNSISLYQFAINEVYRGQGLLKKMLKTINDLPILVLCPIGSIFNEYFYKTGWNLQERNAEFKVWAFND